VAASGDAAVERLEEQPRTKQQEQEHEEWPSWLTLALAQGYVQVTFLPASSFVRWRLLPVPRSKYEHEPGKAKPDRTTRAREARSASQIDSLPCRSRLCRPCASDHGEEALLGDAECRRRRQLAQQLQPTRSAGVRRVVRWLPRHTGALHRAPLVGNGQEKRRCHRRRN
jgi:hypothetical protein